MTAFRNFTPHAITLNNGREFASEGLQELAQHLLRSMRTWYAIRNLGKLQDCPSQPTTRCTSSVLWC